MRCPDVGRVIWILVIMAWNEMDVTFDGSSPVVSVPTSTHWNALLVLCHLAVDTRIYILCPSGS